MWLTGLYTAFALICCYCALDCALMQRRAVTKERRFRTMQEDILLLGADIERARVEVAKLRAIQLRLMGQWTKKFGAYEDDTPYDLVRPAPRTTLQCTDDVNGEARYSYCARVGEPLHDGHLDRCALCRMLDAAKREFRAEKGLKSPAEIAKHAKDGGS